MICQSQLSTVSPLGPQQLTQVIIVLFGDVASFQNLHQSFSHHYSHFIERGKFKAYMVIAQTTPRAIFTSIKNLYPFKCPVLQISAFNMSCCVIYTNELNYKVLKYYVVVKRHGNTTPINRYSVAL